MSGFVGLLDVGSTPTASTKYLISLMFLFDCTVATKTATIGVNSMISECLIKRNDTYYFRLRIPHDIEPYFSRKEIWKSLNTKSYSSAKTSISKLLYHTERLFLHVRSGMYTESEIKQLVKDYPNLYLSRSESLRSSGIVRYESEEQKLVAPLELWQELYDFALKLIYRG